MFLGFNSIHKPPAQPVRIEKVLPLPGGHTKLIHCYRSKLRGIKPRRDLDDLNLAKPELKIEDLLYRFALSFQYTPIAF